MKTDTVKLTVRLPREDVEFAKAYARAHGLSVTEVIDRYLRRIRALGESTPSREIESITGLVPAEADAASEYHDYLREKHSR